MANTPGQGPLSPYPDKEFKQFLAGEAISKGDWVTYLDASTTGYTIQKLDTDDTNKISFGGVAAEDIASGSWGRVQIAGFCDYFTTDGNIAAGSPITATATAGACGVGTVGTHDIMGIALAADSSTTCTAGIIFKRL